MDEVLLGAAGCEQWMKQYFDLLKLETLAQLFEFETNNAELNVGRDQARWGCQHQQQPSHLINPIASSVLFVDHSENVGIANYKFIIMKFH